MKRVWSECSRDYLRLPFTNLFVDHQFENDTEYCYSYYWERVSSLDLSKCVLSVKNREGCGEGPLILGYTRDHESTPLVTSFSRLVKKTKTCYCVVVPYLAYRGLTSGVPIRDLVYELLLKEHSFWYTC